MLNSAHGHSFNNEVVPLCSFTDGLVILFLSCGYADLTPSLRMMVVDVTVSLCATLDFARRFTHGLCRSHIHCANSLYCSGLESQLIMFRLDTEVVADVTVGL